MDDVKRCICHACVSSPRDEHCPVCDPVIGWRSELDAQRLCADAAEAERDHAKEERDSFQRVGIQTMEKLTAAEQRIAELVAAIETYLKGTGNSPGSNRRHAELRAALNPKPEAGSHDA